MLLSTNAAAKIIVKVFFIILPPCSDQNILYSLFLYVYSKLCLYYTFFFFFVKALFCTNIHEFCDIILSFLLISAIFLVFL